MLISEFPSDVFIEDSGYRGLPRKACARGGINRIPNTIQYYRDFLENLSNSVLAQIFVNPYVFGFF